MTTRDAYLAAGLEPKLYPFWRSTSTKDLALLFALIENDDELQAILPDVRDKLALELDFRGNNDCPGFHRAVNGQTVCGYCGKALTR